MKDTDFYKLAELYGFAPSRALRQLLEAVERMEREACARVCDKFAQQDRTGYGVAEDCAAAIRARSQA